MILKLIGTFILVILIIMLLSMKYTEHVYHRDFEHHREVYEFVRGIQEHSRNAAPEDFEALAKALESGDMNKAAEVSKTIFGVDVDMDIGIHQMTKHEVCVMKIHMFFARLRRSVERHILLIGLTSARLVLSIFDRGGNGDG